MLQFFFCLQFYLKFIDCLVSNAQITFFIVFHRIYARISMFVFENQFAITWHIQQTLMTLVQSLTSQLVALSPFIVSTGKKSISELHD